MPRIYARKKHTIKVPDRTYDIHIGNDLLPGVIDFVDNHFHTNQTAILTDQNLVDAGQLKRLDPRGKLPTYIVKPDSYGGVESKKNLREVENIVNFLDENKFSRRDTLICLGGGVIGDMGGVLAHNYKRGPMIYVQLPTSTISFADSSVGGKVAVDTGIVKNGFGGFYSPHLVISDLMSLLSLDDRNYRTGLIETVKHGMIKDRDFLNYFHKNINKIMARDLKILSVLAYKNVQIKGDIVEIDFLEANERQSLNLGHTVGHAIETASKYRLYHGESVGLGLIVAMYISEEANSFLHKDFGLIYGIMTKGLGLYEKVPDFVKRKHVEYFMVNDKKVVNGVPQFVTLDEIGKVHTENGKHASAVAKIILDSAMDFIFD